MKALKYAINVDGSPTKKGLVDILREELAGGMASSGLAATPGNTMGMGNTAMPGPAQVGTEPLVGKRCKKKKKNVS